MNWVRCGEIAHELGKVWEIARELGKVWRDTT